MEMQHKYHSLSISELMASLVKTGEDLTILRLRVDDRGRLFVREEIRDLLHIYPNSEVFVEKTMSGRIKLKIQRRGTVVKVWFLNEDTTIGD